MHKLNWFQRIANAEKSDVGFTHKDRVDAGDWVSCACGEQDPRIPRTEDVFDKGEPLDDELAGLGREFNRAVQDDDYGLAYVTLARIEKRAGEVLKEIESKDKEKRQLGLVAS